MCLSDFGVLSGYRFMWLLVMFDLPVVLDHERKAATRFRNVLLDNGFQMANYSVYLRNVSSLAQSDRVASLISSKVPDSGIVSILRFTDKQYEQMMTFHGKSRKSNENPEMFLLF